MNSIIGHSFPLLASYYNCKTMYTVVKREHGFKIVVPLITVYMYINYKTTLSLGKPLYWFLTWYDWKSGFVVFIFYILGILFFDFVA